MGFADGLPVGMQLLGRAFDEETLLRVGHRLGSSLGTLGQYAPL